MPELIKLSQMFQCKPSEMEPILSGIGLFYCWITTIIGDRSIVPRFGLFRVSHQTVIRGTKLGAQKDPLITPPV